MKYVCTIGITGASSLITTLLLNELFEVPNLGRNGGILVRLYDDNFHDERSYKIMEDTANYYNSLNMLDKEDSVIIVDTLEDMLENCDLLLIVDDFMPSEEDVTIKTISSY